MYTADDATTWHLRADLAIVGASAGGLVAAIAAAHQGCRVVLLERTKELGGSFARGHGMIPAAGTRFQRQAGIQDGPEAFASDILAQNRHNSDPAQTRALCDAAPEVVEWLVDSNITDLEFVPTLMAPGHVTPRMHIHAAGTGAELTADLARTATKSPLVAIRTASVVEDLWVDANGSVVGVAAREKRGPINIAAERVLLACGGFAANADLVADHQKDLAHMPHAGAPGALGDGLRWGTACGAAIDHLGACWATPLVAAPGDFVVPESIVRDGGIIVNQLGFRFANETVGTLPLVHAVLAQPGKVAYLIFDERIYRATRAVNPYFARLIVPRAVRRANNPADLARHFEVEEDNLAVTLDKFHVDSVHQTDPFERSHVGPPLAPPFHAIRLRAARVRTLGGLRVNDAAQVVRPDGTPIPSLYASGGVVANVSGNGVDGYLLGNDVLASVVWGWVAGRASQPRAAA
jgi:fumarate reductase flavoprotein subunit